MVTVTGDTMEREVDYSSYEYQQVQLQVDAQNVPNGNINIDGFANQSVLETRGGLDTNEVAELVAIHRSVHIEPDDYDEDSPISPGGYEFRGVFGNDLEGEAEQFITPPAVGSDGITDVNGMAENQTSADSFGNNQSAVFDFWDLQFGAPFASDAAGNAGGGSYNVLERTLPLRKWYGAGPVMDSGDNVGINATLVSNDAAIGELTGTYKANLVWDIAEVDDAGSRFGIPR